MQISPSTYSGITGNFFKWLQSCLDNRQQRVVICGSSSQWGAIPARVPKGSHLGPLLFIVYINDIIETISSNIKLFADDTSLYVTSDGDAEDATEQLNDDLLQVSQWAENWLVKFNAAKSKAITVTLKTKNTHNLDLPLSLNNTVLDTVSSHKHLGMEITSNLSWKDHILTVSENANKKLNILAKLKMLVDRKSIITMYTSFIRSGMEHNSVPKMFFLE